MAKRILTAVIWLPIAALGFAFAPVWGIALAISALTNPLADMARAQLGTLRGCDAHFSVIISEEDIKLYKRLGIHVSCEPKYESKRLYHK